jgi:long-chain acyl-CoA synthetase
MAQFQETNMPAVFQNQVEKLGDKACTAFKKDGAYVDISWNRMNEMVRNVGSYLISKGVAKGDKVALFSPNRYEWWVADMAILSIGAINVPIYSTNSAEEALYILENSDSKFCFAGTNDHMKKILKVKSKLAGFDSIIVFDQIAGTGDGVLTLEEAMKEGAGFSGKGEFDERLKAIDGEDLATLIYTSGTTGNPKGVMLTHKNFFSNVRQSVGDFSELVTTEDTFFSFLPLSHSLERTVGYYLPVYQGSKVAFVEDVSTTLTEDLLLVRPTIMISVPRIYEKIHSGILSKVSDASGVKKALFNWTMKIAAKNVPYNCTNTPRKGLFAKKYNLADKLVFSKLKEAIGLDRLKFAISGGGPLSVSDSEFFIGMGFKIYEGFGLTETTPVTNVNRPNLIKIGSVGPALMDTEVKISDEGEILIKGPQVMKGYYKNEDATSEVFTEDGYFKTGDIGVIDDDGYLSITGRIKDIIVTAGGKNISPQNIEGSLKSSLYIEQVAVIGDRRKYLTALIVPAVEELQKWAQKNNIESQSVQELLADEKVQNLFKTEVEEYMQEFARVEQIKKFKLLPSEWSQETGELTPSLKVKRRVVEEKYAADIESMYVE